MKTLYTLLLLIFINNLQSLKAQNGKSAVNTDVIFEIVLDTAIKDIPFVMVFENSFYESITTVAEHTKYYAQSRIGSTFKFVLPSGNKSSYFCVMTKTLPRPTVLMDMFHFEPGDQIRMVIRPAVSKIIGYDQTFSGRGALKYTCQQQVMRPFPVAKNMEILNQYKQKISKNAFDRIHADIVGRRGVFEMNDTRSSKGIALGKGDTVMAMKICSDFLNTYTLTDVSDIPKNILYQSRYYLAYRYWNIVTSVNLAKGPAQYLLFLKEIHNLKDQELRDRLLVIYFVNNWKHLAENYQTLVEEAIAVTQNKACLAKLNSFLHNAEGQKVIDFDLTDDKGKIIHLNDFKGKAVFLDFYFTGCAYCKIFYKTVLSEVEKQYSGRKDLQFMTVSIDLDKDLWFKSLKSGDYADESSINMYTNGEGGANKFIQYYNIRSYPSLMLIDRKGQIFKFSGMEMRTKEGLIAALETVLKR